MDEYYQNGPLPTWIGWYVEHLPHWFHAASVAGTLAMELAVVWMLFLPRRARLICFCIVTPWEIGVILTANYTFLNYLVLVLGFLLLDDRSVRWLLPPRLRETLPATTHHDLEPEQETRKTDSLSILETPAEVAEDIRPTVRRPATFFNVARLWICAVLLTWIAYATTAEMLRMPWPDLPLPSLPMLVLGHFALLTITGALQ
jgi:hypothetical protein